jgi:hypothetical protein
MRGMAAGAILSVASATTAFADNATLNGPALATCMAQKMAINGHQIQGKEGRVSLTTNFSPQTGEIDSSKVTIAGEATLDAGQIVMGHRLEVVIRDGNEGNISMSYGYTDSKGNLQTGLTILDSTGEVLKSRADVATDGDALDNMRRAKASADECVLG